MLSDLAAWGGAEIALVAQLLHVAHVVDRVLRG